MDKDKVRSAYNRTDYLERRKKVMYWWSDHISDVSLGFHSITGFKMFKVVARVM